MDTKIRIVIVNENIKSYKNELEKFNRMLFAKLI